ncbi:hypothetical protein EVAR_18524_1 [Eumeta japonica]|uniref:Uncharacterized protein n=1 Tax=Eumeta variegata TaxID=151549 RepID=A0A4C1V3W3_EUMVA|nr:hypothetical protein EVAR_18524_1 [Eumeta japonica]
MTFPKSNCRNFSVPQECIESSNAERATAPPQRAEKGHRGRAYGNDSSVRSVSRNERPCAPVQSTLLQANIYALHFPFVQIATPTALLDHPSPTDRESPASLAARAIHILTFILFSVFTS